MGVDHSLRLDDNVIGVVHERLARTIHPVWLTAEKLDVWRMVERSTAIVRQKRAKKQFLGIGIY